MSASTRTSDGRRPSIDERIAALQADRIEIPVESYHGPRLARARRQGTSVFACFLILWVGLLIVGRDRLLRDPGTLWHPVVGERMLETRQWITTDPFSFTFEGKPWIAQQWLAECAMALAHRLAGLDGLLLGAATLLAATFAWLFGRFRRAGWPVPAAAVLLAMVIAGCSYHLHARPHLVTMALSGWTLGWLIDVESSRRSSRWLFLLPMLVAVWTNLHGGALGGVMMIVLALVAWTTASFLQKGELAVARPIPCLSILILSFLAILLNPYGVEMVRVWLALSTSKVLPRMIDEHGPTAFFSVEGFSLMALGVAYLAILGGCIGQKLRATWLIPLVWLPLAFMRVRHGPIFAVTSAVAMAEMLPRSRWGVRFIDQTARSEPTGTLRPSRGWIIGGAAVVVSLALQFLGVHVPVIGAGWARLDRAYWPVDATKAARDYLARHPGGGHLFNDMLYGGYLIANLPQTKVYIDDRCELYGEDFLLRYVNVLRHPERLEVEADHRRIDLAMVKPETRMANYLLKSPRWSLLHKDVAAVLFARRSTTP